MKKVGQSDIISYKDFINLIEYNKEVSKSKGTQRLLLAYYILYFTGLRLSNLRFIKKKDFLGLLKGHEVFLTILKTKTKGKFRVVLFSKAIQFYKHHLQDFCQEYLDSLEDNDSVMSLYRKNRDVARKKFLEQRKSADLEYETIISQRKYAKTEEEFALYDKRIIELKRNLDYNFNFVNEITVKIKSLEEHVNKNLRKFAETFPKRNLKWSSHSFRASFITTCLKNDITVHDVSNWVGHSNISTTLGYNRTKMKKKTQQAYLNNIKWD